MGKTSLNGQIAEPIETYLKVNTVELKHTFGRGGRFCKFVLKCFNMFYLTHEAHYLTPDASSSVINYPNLTQAKVKTKK